MKTNDIIKTLFDTYKRTYPYIGYNTYAVGWESDILMISRSGYVYEIEVKISKSDFKKDFKKPKHTFFAKRKINKIPIRGFYFAVPQGMISIKDIPEYAGLIYLREVKRGKKVVILREIRKTPPVLSRKKVGNTFRLKLLRSMMFKLFSKL